MSRYVILLHQMPPDSQRPSHWDFMLEFGDVLKTWALAQDPVQQPDQVVDLLEDHRRDYLNYEGPVSGGRGFVARWDAGTYQILEQTATHLRVTIDGDKLRGDVTLDQLDDASQYQWTYKAHEA